MAESEPQQWFSLHKQQKNCICFTGTGIGTGTVYVISQPTPDSSSFTLYGLCPPLEWAPNVISEVAEPLASNIGRDGSRVAQRYSAGQGAV
jgi:hypothetical protein